MYSLPTSVIVNDVEYQITNNGDFRMVLDCFSALNDEELGEDLRVLASLIIFYEDIDDQNDILSIPVEDAELLVKEMYKFFNGGAEESRGLNTKAPLIDWEKDTQIICAAINNVANMEIRAVDYLHWWTFLGYYMSVGESVLSTVVSIRDKLTSGKKLEKWEKDFKHDNPGYFVWKSTDIESREFEAQLKELWKQGGE